MRSVVLFLAAVLLCPFARAQSPVYASSVFEYRPAPGQHINDPVVGTPAAASKIINGIGNPLSLGAYGGYIVLGFSQPVANHPENPYGVDFIIYGNASPTHSEPGIVSVMRDENLNGLPDDTWFEIAGSAYFSENYTKDYSIRYQNPGYPAAADVPWTDTFGQSGKVLKNSFHSQPYYPFSSLFPGIPAESVSFIGSLLKGTVEIQNGTYISLPCTFGYADNTPVNNRTITGIPDNPYTPGFIEGDGGDAIDISWAVDVNGNYVNLQSINFVKIYTGVNGNAGWLGEISSDIRGIADVAPNAAITGATKLIELSGTLDKIALSDTLELIGHVFISGRPAANEEILWSSSNPDIISVTGISLVGRKPGEAELTVRLKSDPGIISKTTVKVVVPQNLQTDRRKRSFQTGEILTIDFSVVDNEGEFIKSILPDPVVRDTNIAGITGLKDNQIEILAKSPGSTLLTLSFPEFPELNTSIELQVFVKTDSIQVYFSLNNSAGSILPVKKYPVGKSDILSLTNRYQQGFNPDKPFITLADAIASALKSEGFGNNGKAFAFRQDEYGREGLYLWQVGFDWEYLYGWGGSRKSSSYAKTWFVVLNKNVFATGFDTIKIADNDRISLQFVEDNGESWSCIRLIAPKDRIETGEVIKIRSEQLDIYPPQEEDGGFTVSGPFPVADSEVTATQSVLNSSLSDQFTSYSGEFNLCFSTAGDFQVGIQNSETLLIHVIHPVSVRNGELFTFYPNPCKELLKISNPGGKPAQIRIYSSDGRLRIQKAVENGLDSVELDTSALESGVYIIEWNSGKSSFRQKLIRL